MAVDYGSSTASRQGARRAKTPSKSGVGASIGRIAGRVAKPKRSNVQAQRVKRKVVSRSSRGRSSSRSSSRSSRSSSRRSSTPKKVNVPKPSAPKKPSIPSLAAYLGTDSAYQGAVSGGKRSLNDYLSELTRRRGEAQTQFTQTQGSMERDRVQQLEDLRNEFASRGLIQSGLYGEEQGNFQQKFTEQANALKQQQAALLADLLGQEKNYRREHDLALQAAKQEALLRRAQKYNIGA